MKKTKVVLIQPNVLTNTMPPLGILYISAVLKKSEYQVKVFDPSAGDDSFLERVKNFHPDIIGLSISTNQYSKAKDVVIALKRDIPDACFCAGSIHSTALPAETLEDLGLDFVVVGEGENTMLEVCDNFEKGYGFKGIKGLIYKEGGKIVDNGRRELIKNLDELPFPDRGALSFEWYLIPPGMLRGVPLRRSTTIISARGCPYSCIYCSMHLLFEKGVRHRSVDKVILEIRYLIDNYRIEGLYFLDSVFTIDRKWVLNLCERLRKEKIRLKMGVQARVDNVDMDLLVEMRKAGFIQIDYGLESGSQKVLDALKKNCRVEQIEKAFLLTRKAGIRAEACCLIGNPEEKIQDIEKTYNLVRRISASFVRFYYITPYPGTVLNDMAIRNHWIEQKLNYSEKWDIRQTAFPIMEINFTKKELSIIRAKYQNRFIFKNHLAYFRNYIFILELFCVILRHPLEFCKSLVQAIRVTRLDDFIEFLIEVYRRDKAKSIKKES